MWPQAMLENGAIDRSTWESARVSEVVLDDGLRASEPHGQYLKEQVRLELVERFGWDRVHLEGLRVFTTLDMPMQVAAEVATAGIARSRSTTGFRRWRPAGQQHRRRRRSGDSGPLQAALVAMQTGTGCAPRWSAAATSTHSRFNRAVQARLGSQDRHSSRLVERGRARSGVYAGERHRPVEPSHRTPLEGAWVPADGHSYQDEMTLRTGLRTSSNRAAVRLLEENRNPQRRAGRVGRSA